ncbi:hypothetical protein SAMN04487783_2226 [Agrococcus baldri]|uniref:Copper amine oxidase n=1 Tax=Agrococcus baldri TaxID=153730 RepID=A0AA94L096_9MICO|nr:hypothetical protein [Agrococcus baldri]SFS16169.1 hypothetical protein SAMN04487783_2226 [Agrococcus baldri]
MQKSAFFRTVAGVGAVAVIMGASACSTPMESDATTSPETSQSPMETMDSGMLQPSGTGDPFADARTAAGHMPMTATTLAGGFATALEIPGETESEAATLRADLTALLQEHVYLAGMAVATAYHAGPDSAQFEAAAAALDTNSVDLSEAVISLSDEEQGAAFLELWREHIGYFVDYAVAVKGGDQAAADEAQANLEGYTGDAGAFFESVSGGELPADAIAENLVMHVDTLSAAIDAFAAGDADATDALQEAAAHMPMSAETLATGLAAAAGLEGDVSDEASTLRSTLAAGLQEHVYLAGIAVFTAYTAEGGPESPAFEGAAATLDANSVALSEAIGSLAGEENGTAFLELWREHIGYFVDYAVAIASDDQAAADQALMELDDYRPTAGAFFEEISAGELPADAIAEGLGMHVETLAGAIDSLKEQLVDAG